MSPSDAGAFSGHSTKALEAILRDPATPGDRRQQVSEELGRRYEAELAGATGATTEPPRRERTAPRRAPSPEQQPGPSSDAPSRNAPPPAGPPPAGPPPAGPPPGRQQSGGARRRGPLAGHSPTVVPPPATRRPRHTGRKILLTFVLLLVAGGGYAVWQGMQEAGTTTPSIGFTCVTDVGDCPLSVSLPLGSACSCVDGAGLQYSGYVD